MRTETSAPPDTSRLRATTRRLAQDYTYVLPGFPLALLSFCLLIPLLAFSLVTVIVWVGVLLLPLTLMIASSFAQLSRTRLALWGASPEPVRYRAGGSGLAGIVKIVADPRRWLDFIFEAIIALPLRLATFCVTVIWTGAVLAGLSYWFWAALIPDSDGGWSHLLNLAYPDLISTTGASAYLVDSGVNLVIGIVALATLPVVMRGLATLDAMLASHLLDNEAQLPSGDADQSENDARRPARDLSVVTLITAVTAVASTIIVAVSWPVLANHYQVHTAIAMVVSIAHAAAAILAVRWAWSGLVLSLAAVLGQMAATAGIASEVFWPWSVTALLTQCLVIAVVALRRPWYQVIATWMLSMLPTFAAPLLFADSIPQGTRENGIVIAGVLAGVGILGILVRLWGLSIGRVEVAEQVSAEEALRRKGLEERNRIARELHDVVAHSMSVINVQASTAKYRRPGIDDPVQQEFEDIADSSRQALGEMRALLAILRGDDAAPTTPVPTVQDIPDLIEATRASGASIAFSGERPDTSPTVGLTAFRVVQEGLSNALRHAPGASIEVTTAVDESGPDLTVRVVNSAPQSDAEPSPGSGLGLAGIRERVTALGGTVLAEPTADGGFSVIASLPLREHEPGDGTSSATTA